MRSEAYTARNWFRMGKMAFEYASVVATPGRRTHGRSGSAALSVALLTACANALVRAREAYPPSVKATFVPSSP